MTRELRWVLIASALLALVLVAAQATGWLEAQERFLHDVLQAHRPASPDEEPDSHLLVIEVTDECVARHGAWPWPRSRLADLVETVTQAGAKVVAMDILFLDPDPKQDPRLASALARAGNVVLAGEVVRRTSWDNDAGELVTRLQLAEPTPALAGAAARIGFVNVDYHFANQDGVVRSLPLALELEGRTQGVLALEAVAAYAGVEPRLRAGELQLGAWRVPLTPPVAPAARSPFVEGRYLEIRFDAAGYLEYQRSGAQGSFPTVRAMDVLAGNVPRDRFRNRLVLVGLNQRGVDRKVTPVGHMAGVQLQAQLVRNLVHQSLLVRQGRASAAFMLVLAVALGAALGSQLAPAWGLGWAVALAGGWLVVGRSLFLLSRLVLDLAAPLLGLLLGLGTALVVVLWLRSRRRMQHLEVLHESGRRFSRTLDLGVLMELVCERYRELAGCEAAALVLRPSEGAEFEAHFDHGFPEELRALLSRRRLQGELLEHLRVSDAVFPSGRLAELADCPEEAVPERPGVLLPLGRFEKALGFVYLVEPEAPGLRVAEERRFWATHASGVATALENAGLYRLATVDALTTLYLRHYFDVSLAREFSRTGRYKGHLALLLTDIDHFKAFNDTHGHQVGDRVLRFVAEQVKASVRGVDIACRYGGEEFAVILPETDFDGALLTAERIRSTIEEAFVEVEGERLQVTISIGMACTDRSRAKNPDAFVKEADEALYKAKEAGRNKVVPWSPARRESDGHA